MNLGFFNGFPELTRMIKSRFYMTESANNTVSGQTNNFQTLEVDAPEVTNCGLHFILKGSAPLVATADPIFIDSQTNRILAGNARGAFATDWQRQRTSATHVASGTNATIGGGANNTVAGTNAVIAGGNSNSAPNTASCVSGGDNNTSSGSYSFVPGGRFGSTLGRASAWAYGTEGSVAAGRQQVSGQGQVATTTNATATATTNNNTPGTLTSSNIFSLQNNSAVFMNARVLARDTAAANDVRAWDIEVVVRRGANAAATTVDFTNVVSVFNTAGAAAWTIAVVAETTVGGFYFNVTGEAGKTIRWMVKIDGVEVA